MVGTIIPAAIAGATSILNGVLGAASARKQEKEQLAAINEQKKQNHDLYSRRMNEDATQRADFQRMLTLNNAAARKRTQAALGKKAVIGGTDSSMATTQQMNAEATGNMMSEAAAKADARKDSLVSEYSKQQNELTKQASDVKAKAQAARRQAMAQAASGVVNSAASVIGAMGDSGAAKAKAQPGGKVENSSNIFDQKATVTSTPTVVTDRGITEYGTQVGITKPAKPTVNPIQPYDRSAAAADFFKLYTGQ